MGKPVAKVHAPGLGLHTAPRFKTHGEILRLNKSKHIECW